MKPAQTKAAIHFACVAMAAAMLLLTAPATRGGSIFDDDYTPPKRAEPAPTPAVPAPSPAPSDTPTPTPTPAPTAHPPDAPPVNPASGVPAVHRAVPDRASRTKCRKLFEEVYAKELKDRTPDGRRKLAQSLLGEAGKAAKDSPDQFVLLNGAMQAAEEAKSLRLCFAAAGELARKFDVDELAAKTDAATKIAAAPSGGLSSVSNIEALFDLADQLAAENEFVTLTRVEAALQHAVPMIADADLRAEAKNQVQEMTTLRETKERIAPALAKLKGSPDDPAANLAVGGYLCFQRGQWGAGLALLAKCSDVQLKDLAEADLAHPTSSDDVRKLADRWFAEGPKLPTSQRRKAIEHAGDLYRAAEIGTTDLQKLAIEKRLAQIPPPSRFRRVDLLDLFDPATSMTKGEWKIQDGSLVCEPVQNGRAEFAYEPPEEYDFKISFTEVHDVNTVTQICYCAGHQFAFEMAGWGNNISAFDSVDGANGSQNKTGKRKSHWLTVGQRYTSVVKVRKAGVEAYLDGQLITGLKTDYSNLGLPDYYRLSRGNVVGIGMEHNIVRFDAAEIVEITGEWLAETPGFAEIAGTGRLIKTIIV